MQRDVAYTRRPLLETAREYAAHLWPLTVLMCLLFIEDIVLYILYINMVYTWQYFAFLCVVKN